MIETNPEQSKHLETARIKIHGHQVDLVNLRSETYTQHSRVPQMEFGTPSEDAYRRLQICLSPVTSRRDVET